MPTEESKHPPLHTLFPGGQLQSLIWNLESIHLNIMKKDNLDLRKTKKSICLYQQRNRCYLVLLRRFWNISVIQGLK